MYISLLCVSRPCRRVYDVYIIILHTRTPFLCVKKPTPVLHAVLQVYHFYTSHAHRTRPATSAVCSHFPPVNRRGGLRISKRILSSSFNKRTHTHNIIGIILLLIFRCIIHTHSRAVLGRTLKWTDGREDYKYVISRWHIKKGLNTRRRHRFNGSGSEEKKQNGYGGDDEGQYVCYTVAASRSCVFRIFRFHYDDYYYYCPPSIFFSTLYILYSLDPLYRSQYIRLRLAGVTMIILFHHNCTTAPHITSSVLYIFYAPVIVPNICLYIMHWLRVTLLNNTTSASYNN